MPELFYALLPTSKGWIGVLGSDLGIRRTTLPVSTSDEALGELGPEARHAQESPDAFLQFHQELEDYFQGKQAHLNAKLDLHGAPRFFRRAWEACQSIPARETRSYQWLAAKAGSPKAARAAGQAMARNPLPLVIPCHRVIGSNGGLGGYGGGLPLKAWLLALEQGSSLQPDSTNPARAGS